MATRGMFDLDVTRNEFTTQVQGGDVGITTITTTTTTTSVIAFSVACAFIVTYFNKCD